jgi:general secretion pathway protein B
MSYILEALRKADAEREREKGFVPGLNAQLLPPLPGEGLEEPAAFPWWRWVGAALVLVLATVVAWMLLGRSDPQPVAVTPPPAVAPVAQTAQAPTPAPVPAPKPPSAPAQDAAAGPAVPPPQAPRSAPAETVKAAPRKSVPSNPLAQSTGPSARASNRPGAEPRVPSPGRPKAEGTSPKATDAPPDKLPTLADLPPDLRQLVPQLVVGGSVYSPQASVRMVVFNGQVFQEGNALTAELTLEQIRPKTAVLSIRGQRFQMPL